MGSIANARNFLDGQSQETTMYTMNETHDPNRRSWVRSANTAETDFTIQNLPFAVFRRKNTSEIFRGGVAIGDQIVDLLQLDSKGILGGDAAQAAAEACKPQLNDFMNLGPRYWSALRLALSNLLKQGADSTGPFADCLQPQTEAEYHLPCQIGDFTDFYTSIYHATKVGKLFRPENPLLPNYKWVPIGYHGRASSFGVSGQDIHRPWGQTRAPDVTDPVFSPCKRVDFELELGAFIGSGNALGQPIAMGEAENHIFGLSLLNDWSARDIQAWEYQPLGPFLAKSFASTISPWIVTLEALAPYRAPFARDPQDPQPLPYLDSNQNSESGHIDINLQVYIQSEHMRQQQITPHKLSIAQFANSYWTLAQLVAHHTSNGCNLNTGDILGTGTQSGPSEEESGAMIEITKGKIPISLPSGEERVFLEDGDTIIFKGFCEKAGFSRIGFGECSGTILPAISPDH
ncbi:MAG: fumarylacetoacetase [Lacipirellulaceae bacterium]